MTRNTAAFNINKANYKLNAERRAAHTIIFTFSSTISERGACARAFLWIHIGRSRLYLLCRGVCFTCTVFSNMAAATPLCLNRYWRDAEIISARVYFSPRKSWCQSTSITNIQLMCTSHEKTHTQQQQEYINSLRIRLSLVVIAFPCCVNYRWWVNSANECARPGTPIYIADWLLHGIYSSAAPSVKNDTSIVAQITSSNMVKICSEKCVRLNFLRGK